MCVCPADCVVSIDFYVKISRVAQDRDGLREGDGEGAEDLENERGRVRSKHSQSQSQSL